MRSTEHLDGFTELLGPRRSTRMRSYPPDRVPQEGDMAFACPGRGCASVHFRFNGDDPHVTCGCGETFNVNRVGFIGRVRADGTLDPALDHACAPAGAERVSDPRAD